MDGRDRCIRGYHVYHEIWEAAILAQLHHYERRTCQYQPNSRIILPVWPMFPTGCGMSGMVLRTTMNLWDQQDCFWVLAILTKPSSRFHSRLSLLQGETYFGAIFISLLKNIVFNFLGYRQPRKFY